MSTPTEDPADDAERDGAITSEQGFAVGSLCRLSGLGLKNMPRQNQRLCTVVGFGSTRNQVRVKFAGSKAAKTLHSSYLELIASSDIENHE
jgi:hypothetical protein